MKPWQKIAVGIAVSLAVVLICAVAALLSFLPEPSSVGRLLYRTPAPADDASPVLDPAQPLANITSLAPANRDSKLTSLEEAERAIALRKKRVTEKFVDRYLLTDRIQSRVCENLANSIPPFQDAEEFGEQLKRSLLGEAAPSATAEAVILPIEFILKNDAVRELIKAAQAAAERGDTGFLQKAQFYALAASATASVVSSQDDFNAVSANAYPLWALGRAAARKPEILQDPELGDFCRGLERGAVDGVHRDHAFDRGRMLRLLAKHEITNESIGYDPKLSTNLSVVTTDGSLQVDLPWLEAILK